MRILTLATFGLALAATPLAAQTAMGAAPVPGPYQVITRPQATAPSNRPQRYAPPLPYWMQVQPRPSPQGTGNNRTEAPARNRAPQQPYIAGWNWTPAPQGRNPNSPGYGSGPTPSYFPGYNAGPQGQQFGPPPGYGQPWGTPGFMPMQGGPNGPNMPYGYGFGNQPGYGMQPNPRQ